MVHPVTRIDPTNIYYSIIGGYLMDPINSLSTIYLCSSSQVNQASNAFYYQHAIYYIFANPKISRMHI